MQLSSDNFIDDLERWANSYLKWMRVQDYSNNTIDLYSRTINQFIEYSLQYQEEMVMEDIKSNYINGFISYLESEAQLKGRKINVDGKYLSKATKDAYMKALKAFFSYISDNNDDLYTFDRFFKVFKQRDKTKPEDKMKYLNDGEITRLLKTLNATMANKDNYNSYRNSLLIKLMLYGGLRISEALSIKLEDFEEIDEDVYMIRIYGKGGKYQTAHISKNIIADELEYFINGVKLKNNEILMKTKNNTKLDRRSALTTINRIYANSTISKKGLHILRHTFAMILTKKGTDLVTIKKLLRHSSITTTTIYSSATKESVIDAIESMR